MSMVFKKTMMSKCEYDTPLGIIHCLLFYRTICPEDLASRRISLWKRPRSLSVSGSLCSNISQCFSSTFPAYLRGCFSTYAQPTSYRPSYHPSLSSEATNPFAYRREPWLFCPEKGEILPTRHISLDLTPVSCSNVRHAVRAPSFRQLYQNGGMCLTNLLVQRTVVKGICPSSPLHLNFQYPKTND